MRIQFRSRCVRCAGVITVWAGFAGAHPAPDGPAPTDPGHASAADVTTPGMPPVSGQGELQFRVFADRTLLPEPARTVLTSAHGGFAVDRRAGKGETYFALAGAGILRIRADLTRAELLNTPAEMSSENLHNTTFWHDEAGASRLVFPANAAARVFTTTLDGHLISALVAPGPEHRFDPAVVNSYFDGGGAFVPTDVEHLDGRYYITTGYSPLDFVLTARVQEAPLRVQWDTRAFGGRGQTPGTFGTGHGITVVPGTRSLAIADRPHAEIDFFSGHGTFLHTLELPAGSFPCDIDYAAGYAVVGCLHGPDRNRGAPIYLLRNGEVVSTILPKEELGMDRFQHIHNAVLRRLNGRLYIIAQAWNPGDFVILEQHPPPESVSGREPLP